MRTCISFRAVAAALLPLVAAGALTGCGTELNTVPVTSQPGTTTTLIMVRHAERDEGLDPPLNAEGQQRAAALVEALRNQGVTAIYAPDLARNRQTAQPLADALGLQVNVVALTDIADTRSFANRFVDEVLPVHAGGVVLFIGNTGPAVGEQSGNLQELYARLGGDSDPPVRYQDLYIIVIPEEGKGDVHFIKAEYGGPSSLD